MAYQSIKATPQKSIKRLYSNWEQAINIERPLKEWLKSCKADRKKERFFKGRFGERLCSQILKKEFSLKEVESNLKTPYGEVDKVFKKSSVYFAVEVKLLNEDRELKYIWSKAQRKRFYKSCFWLETQMNFGSLEKALVLIYLDCFKFINLRESFWIS